METIIKTLSELEIKAHVSPGVAPLVNKIAVKGEGCYVWTSDGQKYLDLSCGIGVTSTGHCHPKVAKAVAEQATTLIHAQ